MNCVPGECFFTGGKLFFKKIEAGLFFNYYIVPDLGEIEEDHTGKQDKLKQG